MASQNNYQDVKQEYSSNNYLPSIAIVFYMILLSSSVVGQKLISVFDIVIYAGNIIFSITYMLVVCITELYGLKQAKKIIITGAICNIFASGYFYLMVKIPGATFWVNQDPFSKTILITANILFTSTIAYVVSEIANAKIVARLKIFFNNKLFIIRAIASTSIATIVDTTFMLPVIIKHSPDKIMVIYASLIFIKLLYSLVLIPFLWILVEFLKKNEHFPNNKEKVPFSSVYYYKKIHLINKN